MNKLSREEVREVLNYDPMTGKFFWKKRCRKRFRDNRSWNRWNNMYSGKEAGYTHQNKQGYKCVQIRVLGHLAQAHRLAWLLMTDEELPEQIDHKNRDGTDNRWSNLRSSTPSKNQRNKSMSRRNTSGCTGVHWHKSRSKWVAQCGSGKTHKYLGIFEDFEEAKKVVTRYRLEQGYSPEHGLTHANYM